MNYQDAKSIRGKSYISHLTDKLSQGQGIGSAIRGTLSDKSKARTMGYKEMFDPMNIAKFMTGGSKFAPALLGSMTGRSQQDIQHFSGSKAKSAGNTATKIGSLESDNKVLDILIKMYELIKNTSDNDTRRRETESQFTEEQEMERERRHKALIEAITGRKQSTAVPTATKSDDGGIMGVIMGLVSGLIGDAIKGVMAIVSGITGFITMLTEAFGGLAKVGSIIPRLGAFLFTPLGAGLLAGASLLTLLAVDKNPEATNKGIQAAGDIGEANRQIMDVVENTTDIERRKQNLLAARPSSKKSFIPWKDPQLQKQYLTEIGFDDSTGLTAIEKQQGYTGIDSKGNPIKQQSASPVTPKSGVAPEAPSPVSEEPTSKPAMSRQDAGPELMKQISAASSKLNSVTSENLELNLPSTPDSVVDSQITNNTNINSTKSQRPKGAIPSVRNTEVSFERMLLDSLRVV